MDFGKLKFKGTIMTCIRIPGGFACCYPDYRLRLNDGGYVFMAWHNYCGPTFYKDKLMTREINKWWDNKLICDALDWFTGRGEIT